MIHATLALQMPKHKRPPLQKELDAPVEVIKETYSVDFHRLRAVWDAEKARPGSRISQKQMAIDWGVNASNITQYLNGHIKLNTEAKLRFASYLKKPVLEIWPDFELASVAPGELPGESVKLAALWTLLPESSKKAVSDLIHTLSGITYKN